MAQKVLIADDSPSVQKKASGILTGEGLEVVTVSNGVAAIKKLPTVNPMVIIADVSMPGKDGYEVCEFVKSSPDFLNVPVLLVYSDDDIYDEQKGSRARADGRIRKPFDPAELIATVKKFLTISEASAAQTQAAAAAVLAKPAQAPPSAVYESADEEPEVSKKEAAPDFAAFGGGIAFAEPALEEIEAATPEAAVETGSASEAESPIEPEPTTSFESAPPGADDFVIPQEHEPLLQAEPGPLEELIIEAEAPVAQEPGTEPAAEKPWPAVAEHLPPVPAEPVFIEEQEHPLRAAAPVVSATERTVMFRIPADIAQPVFSDELAASASPTEAPPAQPDAPEAGAQREEAGSTEVEQSASMGSEGGGSTAALEVTSEASSEVVAAAAQAAPDSIPVSATTLESYSLSEAAAGHVRFAPAEDTDESQATPAAALPGDERPTEAALAATAPGDQGVQTVPAEVAPLYDPALIYSIVYRVVAKTSPRMSAQMVEDMSRNLTDEITAELNEPSSQNS